MTSESQFINQSLHIAALTEKGRVRKNNEDGLLLDGETANFGSLVSRVVRLGDRHIFAVADGMGGHAKGEVASALALNLLAQAWRRTPENLEIFELLRAINRDIYVRALEHRELSGMGTTLAGVQILNNAATWFNVGDSRVYIFRDRTIRQLTKDHVPEESSGAGGRKRSHAITQALGGSRTAVEIWPSIGSVKLMLGDSILICADGVTDSLRDSQICEVLSEQQSVSNAARILSSMIESNGALDNYTILLANVRAD